jgi:phosphohistidine phosphatase SixA
MSTRRAFTLAAVALAGPVRAQSGGEEFVARLREGRCAFMLRHAQTTPGVGDPPEFRLEACATQRNLSDEGRAQARAIGAWFASRGLRPRAVRSSAWCRCKDTADLAFSAHEVWTALNSTFGDAGAGQSARPALLKRLSGVPRGAFEVWVTHQVNITALTGESTAMGEGVLLDAQGRVVGRNAFR